MSLKIEQLDKEVEAEMKRLYKRDFIKVYPGGVTMPAKYKEIAQRIRDMEVRQDDVWVVSFPRTGSTWAQEMVWCVGNGVDLEAAKKENHFRNPQLELPAWLEGAEEAWWRQTYGDHLEVIENTTTARYIKTHLPLSLLPTQIQAVKPKIVYVARNIKDVTVSSYQLGKLFGYFTGTFQEACQSFMEDKVNYGPFYDHVLGFWKIRDEPNIFFLKYEDMKKDLPGTLKKVSHFLEKELDEAETNKLLAHLSFEEMKKNKAVNYDSMLKMRQGEESEQDGDQAFIRKGQVGDWMNHMTEEVAAKFDKWTEKNLEGTKLQL